MPPRQPRHAAPRDPARRPSIALPGTLLSIAGVAFAGLAVMPAAAAEITTPQLVAATTLAPVEAPTRVPVETVVELPEPPTQANLALGSSLAQGLAVVNSPSPSPSPVAAPPAPASPEQAAPAKASRDRKQSNAFVRPGQGRLTSGFGRRWGRLHAGIDLASGIGSPVRAVMGGTVESAGREGGYGRVVRIDHGNGTVTVYAHMSALLVSRGEKVVAGEKIGREGNTGQSTGPHLHFEVRVNGAPVNPRPWLAKRGIKL